MSIPITTIIYGPINITANATSGIGIVRVEFYVDGSLKATDTAAPYTYLWNPLISFNGTSLKHTIMAVAYDTQGDSASAEMSVTKWRFHPLPFIVAGVIAGVGIASKLLLHTTVTGLFFDVAQSRFTVSFYAIRIHYSTNGPIKHVKGIVNFKSCTGGILIGPIKMTRIGLYHNIAVGTFTFLGDIHYNIGGFRQGFTTASSTTTLKDMIQNLIP
jgi:hypothetical protein